MIWNMRRRKKKHLTWIFNETINLVTAKYTTNFTDGGNKRYIGIYINASRGIMEYVMEGITEGTTSNLEVYSSRRGWLRNSYKKSHSKKNPPANCWRSCKRTPHHYEKGAHMNLRNTLRYIYIYRLNLAKAGWEYDLQPCEKWRREAKASGSHACFTPRINKICLLEREHGSCNGRRILPRNHCGGSSKPYCSAWLSRLEKYSWGKASSETFGFVGLCLSGRRLTPKGVTA